LIELLADSMMVVGGTVVMMWVEDNLPEDFEIRSPRDNMVSPEKRKY